MIYNTVNDGFDAYNVVPHPPTKYLWHHGQLSYEDQFTASNIKHTSEVYRLYVLSIKKSHRGI